MPLISLAEAGTRGYDPPRTKMWTVDRNDQDVEISHPQFGRVRTVVVTDANGTPLWERPQYNEGPHIVAVAWGRKARAIHVGLVLETRPHAEHPERDGDQDFWGVPRGFLKPDESAEDAVRREVGDEAGGRIVLSTHDAGWINPNPTFVGTFSPLIFAEVDLERIEQVKPERHEKIIRAEYFALDDLLRAINGIDYAGGRFEDGVSLAALMRFFAWVTISDTR